MPNSRAVARVASRKSRLEQLEFWVFAIASAVVLLGAAAAKAQENIISSHGIATFDELKYPEDFKHLDYVNPDAPKGGEMSMAVVGSFDSMNPYSRKGSGGALSTIMYESLLTGTADEIGGSYGLLAERLEYPEDKSWVIFHIRPEARFSDGTEVTADDVFFVYNLFLNEGLTSYRTILAKQVESAEVLSPLSIKFTFSDEADKRSVIENVGGLPIFKSSWFEETGAILDENRLETPPGSGPYMRGETDVGRRLTYVRNPDYWGADLPINVGRNNFDTIRIEYFGDQTSAFEAFSSGGVHFQNENSSKTWATGYDFPAVKNGTVIKAELYDGNIASGQAFVFNLRREKFQDIRVREAIGLMFNFEWSNETLFYGLYARVNSFWENSDLQAMGKPEGEELALLDTMRDILRPEVFDQDVPMAPVSGNRQLDRNNLRRASQLLDEAGWVVGSDGLRRNAQGQTLDVEFLERSPAFDRVILPYVDNLKKLGVNASLNRVDFPQFSERRQTFDYDIITAHLGGGYEPGDGLEQRWGGETAEVSIFNPAGFSSEATDRLIDVIKAAKTREELHIAVRALDRVLRVEKIWVPEWYKDVHTVAYYDVFGYPEDLPPYDFGYLDFWWFDAEKQAALKASGALK